MFELLVGSVLILNHVDTRARFILGVKVLA